MLGWQWTYSSEQAVMASAESLIEFGMVNVEGMIDWNYIGTDRSALH